MTIFMITIGSCKTTTVQLRYKQKLIIKYPVNFLSNYVWKLYLVRIVS